MKKVRLYESFISEAKRGTIHKAVKAGDYPATIVVIENGKVVHQETVNTPEAVPASFNVLQKEYPKAKLHVEDKGGQTLFVEGLEINEGSFVVWYEDQEGKHLLGTFHNKKAAEKYKSEEEDEMLNTKGVESVGMMSKDMWDKKEAPYIKEDVNEAKADGTISDDEDKRRADLVKRVKEQMEEILASAELDAKDIGGSFRAPGIIAEVRKEIEKQVKKFR